jgi:hypothetical protein
MESGALFAELLSVHCGESRDLERGQNRMSRIMKKRQAKQNARAEDRFKNNRGLIHSVFLNLSPCDGSRRHQM